MKERKRKEQKKNPHKSIAKWITNKREKKIVKRKKKKDGHKQIKETEIKKGRKDGKEKSQKTIFLWTLILHENLLEPNTD